MKFLIGQKLEMTQIFKDNGVVVPVTKVVAGPCTVVQVKNQETDGYRAIQFGYGEKKAKNINKPQLKHFNNLGNFRYVKEMRIEDAKQLDIKVGDIIDTTSFVAGDKIKVTGTSKGRGFQGVVKRHGFAGSLKTHGHKDQHRMPGSAGATGPAHVFKGMRMGGHMGDEQVTVTNLEVVQIDEQQNILYIKGAVPGARNGLIVISGEGELNIKSKIAVKVEATALDESSQTKSEAPTNTETSTLSQDQEIIEENLAQSEQIIQATKQENKQEKKQPDGQEK